MRQIVRCTHAPQLVDDLLEVKSVRAKPALQRSLVHPQLRRDARQAAAARRKLALGERLDLPADVERKAPDHVADEAFRYAARIRTGWLETMS